MSHTDMDQMEDIQVRSNVGMVDATDLEPCTEYLVMIRSS